MSHPIQIKSIDSNLYEGTSSYPFLERYFGGEVMAQALLAGSQTVEKEIVLHSSNFTFLKESFTDRPLIHQINRLKDGRQFSVRQINIMQDDDIICTGMLSYQLPETGPEHQAAMPDVPMPEDVESDEDRFYREAPPEISKNNPLKMWPFDFREVDPVNMFNPEKKPPHAEIWMKSKERYDDDVSVQQTMLMFASDSSFLATALRPHGLGYWVGNVQQATLNHALWFHRPFNTNEWLLFAMESPLTHAARGIVYGSFFNREGQLVATAIQEGVIRPLK